MEIIIDYNTAWQISATLLIPIVLLLHNKETSVCIDVYNFVCIVSNITLLIFTLQYIGMEINQDDIPLWYNAWWVTNEILMILGLLLYVYYNSYCKFHYNYNLNRQSTEYVYICSMILFTIITILCTSMMFFA